MSIRDLNEEEFGGERPPSTDLFAAEYVLGVLDAGQHREAEARIRDDAGFARLVQDWELRLAPLLDGIAPVAPPPHVWPRIRTQLGWAAVESARPGLWQNAGFWRGAALLAAAAALTAVAIGPLGLFRPVEPEPGPAPVAVVPDVSVPDVPVPDVPVRPPVEDPDAPKPVTTLARDDGSPGWLASVDPEDGTVLMVPVPGKPDAEGREPELWLIPPGEAPKSLGIVSIDRSHTVAVPDALRAGLTRGAILAITLEPKGGAPGGVATGPIVAKGDMVLL